MALDEPSITIHGSLTADPELSFTSNGIGVVRFTVAQNPRYQDEQWKEGITSFFRCEIWGKPAENVAETFGKGDLVLVVGRMRTNRYDKDSETKQYQFVACDVIGASVMARPVSRVTATTS